MRGRLEVFLSEKEMILCIPNGFCAGVDRAVKMVELALKAYGTPLYVQHEIVHNKKVVNDLREKGVVFVNDLGEIPDGSRVIFSAHGISPSVRERAVEKKLITLDATCPLVTKVHREAVRFASKGYHIFLIGHKNHVEVRGTFGEAPDHITIVEPGMGEEMDRAVMNLPDIRNDKLIYLTQTTLSLTDCHCAVRALKKRFSRLQAPPKDDICYATTNRQSAVTLASPDVDFFVVIGSSNSSNSKRLVEVAENAGVPAALFPEASYLKSQDWSHIERVGVTAGASTPLILIDQVIAELKSRGFTRNSDKVFAVEETTFPLPKALTDDLTDPGISV
jgi:4-hydroxy-3-methylbut-2-enyl diphosphate reductase